MVNDRMWTATDHVLEQVNGLMHTIKAVETIEPTGPIERVQARFLLQAYRRRLRAIVAAAPDWVVEEILSASQHIDEGRSAVWLSDN
jgi:hypothetical protein